MKNLTKSGILTLTAGLLLSACGSTAPDNDGAASSSSMDTAVSSSHSSMDMDSSMSETDSMDHQMVHDQSGEIPEGLQEAENPTYAVGDKVILHTDHMAGMEGAEATIVGAYNTTAYAVSYDPTDGGERVNNHKWVVQEEIPEADETPIPEGTEVTLQAKHMEGMEGAKAVIDSSEATTVYMVDYQPTDGGETIRNHQWVVEEEISPAP